MNDTPDAPRVIALLDAAHDEVCRICEARWNGGDGWLMSIPARPDRDSDIIIATALMEAREFIQRAARVVPPGAVVIDPEGEIPEAVVKIVSDALTVARTHGTTCGPGDMEAMALLRAALRAWPKGAA